MVERRRTPRRKIFRGRVWIAKPVAGWAELLDTSPRGIRIAASHPPAPGIRVHIHQLAEGRFGPARAGTVVYQDAAGAGVRFDREPPTEPAEERRAALRVRTQALRAWITWPLCTPARVLDLSTGGARIEPGLPIQPGALVCIDFMFGPVVVARRTARVRYQADSGMGICFVDTPC